MTYRALVLLALMLGSWPAFSDPTCGGPVDDPVFFDGVDDYVDFGTAFNSALADGYSVSFMATPSVGQTSAPESVMVFSPGALAISYDEAAGEVNARVVTEVGLIELIGALAPDVEQRIMVWALEIAGNVQAELHVDGQVVDSGTVLGDTLFEPFESFFIGAFGADDLHFSGMIRQFRFSARD